jgi:endo-1,3(4)-beta-glucanase
LFFSLGGLVSCGCRFNGDGCDNKAPDCPAFSDQGLNFGNAFYNDQHFHYGYHIYSAAIVAHFRPEWGKKFYEQVLLLIRSIANPSKEDGAFPLHRHKDWYKGSSWASGVPLPPYLNGKNQESSSEAIAAYEAVALYGQIMVRCCCLNRPIYRLYNLISNYI